MVKVKLNRRFFAFLACLIAFIVLLMPLGSANAQTYRFTLPSYEVEAYLEADGTLTLYYYMEFANDTSASPLDFVDLALPYADYDLKDIEATINGLPMPEINDSAYVYGAELALKEHAIPPGQTGTVIAWVRGIKGVIFPYDQADRENYANFQFEPNFFGAEYDKSRNTEYRMTIILPPGVGPEEGVYYLPTNWPGEDIDEASLTNDGRVYYSWYSNAADVHTSYQFGAAFPASVIPSTAITDVEDYNPPSSGGGGVISGIANLVRNLGCGLVVFIGLIIGWVVRIFAKGSSDTRKLKYLPPKLSVAGKGIKRGLTAVEAGVLLEEPLDKILTMILFGLLKKEAVQVVSNDPMQIKPLEPLPEGLHKYELDFIKAMKLDGVKKQRVGLQALLVSLVKNVEEKMKGFSLAETKEYYNDIVRRAWLAVMNAETPEIKSAQFDHTLEWTMLDEGFNDRTENAFLNQPVVVPRWWYLYNPGFSAPSTGSTGSGSSGGLASPAVSSSGGSSKPSLSMPNIPGSDFAAGIINGATNFSAGIVGNLTGFTNTVAYRTNPVPVSRPSSGSGGFRGGGGGSSCACACACAGCACACAGGGR